MTPPRQNDINLMLASHDKRIREASGILSRLYRLVLLERNITPYKWNMLLTSYLDRMAEQPGMSQDTITNERNNLRKGLSEPNMTFGMLTRGLAILNPRRMIFEVELAFEGDVTLKSNLDMLSPEKEGLGKLSELYRNILAILGKDVNHLEKEINAYLSNTLVREEVSGRKRGNDKGNLRRELPGENITWEVFKKGLRVLAPISTIVRVKLKWNRNNETVHQLVIITPKRA